MANKKKKIFEGAKEALSRNPKKTAAAGAGLVGAGLLTSEDKPHLNPLPKHTPPAPNKTGVSGEGTEVEEVPKEPGPARVGVGAVPKVDIEGEAPKPDELAALAASLPEFDQKKDMAEFEEALKSHDASIQKASEAYTRSTSGIAKAKLWKTLVQGFTQIFAGMYGLRNGVNVGGLKFDPIDYKEELEAARAERDGLIRQASATLSGAKEKIGQRRQFRQEERQRSRDVFDIKKAAMAQAQQNLSNKLRQTDQDLRRRGLSLEAQKFNVAQQERRRSEERREEFEREKLGIQGEREAAKASSKKQEKLGKDLDKAKTNFNRALKEFQKDETDENRERLRLLNSEAFKKTGRFIVPPTSFETEGLLFGTNDADTQDILKAQQKFLSLSDAEQQAASWAYANQGDKRSKQILKKLKLTEE